MNKATILFLLLSACGDNDATDTGFYLNVQYQAEWAEHACECDFIPDCGSTENCVQCVLYSWWNGPSTWTTIGTCVSAEAATECFEKIDGNCDPLPPECSPWELSVECP